jgi:hypothetical protein
MKPRWVKKRRSQLKLKIYGYYAIDLIRNWPVRAVEGSFTLFSILDASFRGSEPLYLWCTQAIPWLLPPPRRIKIASQAVHTNYGKLNILIRDKSSSRGRGITA